MQYFQGCLRPFCVHPICFIRKSTEFHDMLIECQRKIILIHFLLCILYFDHFSITRIQIVSLTDHSFPDPLLPDYLLHNAHSPITHSSQSLSPRSLTCGSDQPIRVIINTTMKLLIQGGGSGGGGGGVSLF